MAETPNTNGRNLIAALLILMALAFLTPMYSWFQDVGMAQQATHWPTVQGDITSSMTEEATSKSCSGTNKYQLAIRYNYLIAEQIYKNSRVAFGPSSCLSKDQATIEAHQYREGPIKVWYDPDHPENSALVVGSESDGFWSSIYTVIILSSTMLLCAGWLIFGRSKTKQTQL